jgi:hypothetical protein
MDQAREARTAMGAARLFAGAAAQELPELWLKYTAALGEATATTTALMEQAGGHRRFCRSREDT